METKDALDIIRETGERIGRAEAMLHLIELMDKFQNAEELKVQLLFWIMQEKGKLNS